MLINFLLTKHITVCVTGAGAGADSAWEQKKLEARKMLENGIESPASSARFVGRLPLSTYILFSLILRFISISIVTGSYLNNSLNNLWS